MSIYPENFRENNSKLNKNSKFLKAAAHICSFLVHIFVKRNISSKIIPATQRKEKLRVGGGGGGLDPNKVCASYSKLP